MFIRTLRALIAGVFLFLCASPGFASQGSNCIPTTGGLSGLSAIIKVNAALDALITANSGATAPSNACAGSAVKGQVWLDTSAARNVLKIYDGTSWLALGTMDPTNHLWMPPVGGGAGAIVSANTTDLGTAAESYITISGTTTITGFGTSAAYGSVKTLRFSGALTLTHNVSAITLPSAANIVTAPGDHAVAVYLGGTTWTVLAYTRANGQPLIAPGAGPVTTLASAATTDLGTITSQNVSITGTATITAFGSSASTVSSVYYLTFTGAATLTHNATSLILPGGGNIVTAAGDTAIAVYLGFGNWRVYSYTTAAPAAAVSVPVRQTALASPTDSQGQPAFISATYAGLTQTTVSITTTAPLVVTAAAGWSNSQGRAALNRVGQATANFSWSAFTNAATNYFFVTVNTDGTLTPGFTTTAPIYQFGGAASVTSGQYTYVIADAQMYLGNGSVASPVYVVFLGEADTAGSVITATRTYALNGVYEFTDTGSLPTTAQTKNHNLGVTVGVVSALAVVNATTELGFSVGETVSPVMGYANSSAPHALTPSVLKNTVIVRPGAYFYWVLGGSSLTLANWRYRVTVRRVW